MNYNEAKQVGIVYHFTTESAIQTLFDEEWNKSCGCDILTFTLRNKHLSTTRDYMITNNPSFSTTKYKIRIAFDGNKLSNKYKIEPINGLMDNNFDIFGTDKNKFRVKHKIEREEVICPLKNEKYFSLKDYVLEIQVLNTISKDTLQTLQNIIEKKKLNIKLNIVSKWKPFKQINILKENIMPPNNIIKSFSDKSGKSENEVEKLWNELKIKYKDDYEKITGTLKKILKINEASKGTYVARKVKNAESLYNHYKNQGVNVIPIEELHCTIAYSKKEFKPELNSKDIEIMYDEDIYPYLEPLGNDGCIVMKFKSKEMTERWQDCIDRGATYDYESYIPHITIAIDEKDLDLKSIRKPDFDIILSNEYTEELNLNWKDKLTESTNIKSIKEKFKDYFKKINIYEYNDKVSIDLIITNEKNQGYGTKLMNEIVDYCDKTNKTIILTPSDEFGGNKKRLIEFYKRFGFLENKGKNKIFDIFESMYRLPKNKTNEDYKGLNMEIEKLVEGLGKAKLSFVTKAMIKEGMESLTEDKLNEYLDLFEEYKNVVLESEKFATLVEGKDVDSLSESEIEDLIEKCSEEMEDKEDEDGDEEDEDEEDIKENYIGKAMLELSKGNTGTAIENFKSAMLSTLSKNEIYKEIDSKMSLYINEVEIYKATFTDPMGNKKIIKSNGSIVNANNIPKSITDINYLVNKSDVEKETGNTGTKQYTLYLNKRILQAVSKSKNNDTFAKELNNIFKTKVFKPE